MDRFPLASFCPSFRSAPAPGLLFLSGAHRQVLERLLAGIDGDRPTLVLTGEAGTGKTTLARHLGLLCKNRRTARIGESSAQLIDLRRQLPKALGLAHSPAFDDPETGPQALAQACRDSGQRYLLIVDEAQGLSDAGLDYLARLTEAPAGIALLLVGGAGLDALLARPAHGRLRARILGRFRLLPLDGAETAAYVAHGFRVPGCACHEGVQVFDEAAVRYLHALSGGIPRVINHLVQSCLFEAGAAGRRTMDGAFVAACLSGLIRDGRLAHLIGPAASPWQAPPAAPAPTPVAVQDNPPPPATPAHPQPSRPRHRAARPRHRAARTGAAAVLVGLVVLVPGHDPGTTTQAIVAGPVPAPPPVRAPAPSLPSRVTLQDPPAPERLLAEALTLGSADPARAARLYARAGLWGNGRAAYYLGQLHETGVGVDADPYRARAWYGAAGDTGGAASRLADLAASLPQAPGPAATAAPVPVLQMLFRSGQTELHWQGPPDGAAPRFRVEFVPAGGGGQVAHFDTALPAALIPQPVARWRVSVLRGDGSTGPASAWSRLLPGPR